MPCSSKSSAEIALDPRERVLLADRDQHVVAGEVDVGLAGRNELAPALLVLLRRDLFERDAGQLAVLVRERLRHEDSCGSGCPRARRPPSPTATPSSRRSPSARRPAPPRRPAASSCGSSPSRYCRRPARRRACRSSSCGRTTRSRASRCRCGCSSPASRRPGNVDVAPARRAAADEHRVELLGEQRLQAVDALPGPEVDAEIEHVAHFLVDHRLRQPELRDLRAHHPAALRVAVEDDALVAERRQVARDRERRRTGAHERDALAVALRRGAEAAGRGCRPCSRRRRASAGRWRPARACPCRHRPLRPGRDGTRARTGGRRFDPRMPGKTFDSQLTR